MPAEATARFDRDYFASAYKNYAGQNPARKLRFYRDLIERELAGAVSPTLLEIGCGPGAFLGALDRPWSAFGSDVSADAIKIARARNPRARFVLASGDALPFARKFDIIVAFDVLEHVPGVRTTFDQIAALLAPNGVFVFVVPVYDGLSGPVIRMLDRDPTHVHKNSRQFWLDLAAKRFRVADWYGITRYLLPGGLYVNWPTRLWRRHTPAIAVVARTAPA